MVLPGEQLPASRELSQDLMNPAISLCAGRSDYYHLVLACLQQHPAARL